MTAHITHMEPGGCSSSFPVGAQTRCASPRGPETIFSGLIDCGLTIFLPLPQFISPSCFSRCSWSQQSLPRPHPHLPKAGLGGGTLSSLPQMPVVPALRSCSWAPLPTQGPQHAGQQRGPVGQPAACEPGDQVCW